MDNHNRELVILDCTIRDGNYAIDFKFTEADTALLVGELDRLGFPWIEIGHGLGLGAEEAGKSAMPADSETMIRAAKSAAARARVGAFFIPGIGTCEQMERALDAGLDFIRLGYDAEQIEKTFPFVEHARDIGLVPCVNLMKTYAMSPEDFARAARRAEDAGAEVVYVVDSAGCMLPERVKEYFQAGRAACDCRLGFHGHNNLMMAVMNCAAAWEGGASFLDTSLCGMGRSAGNAPTEITIAVLERMGIATGYDLFAIMDVIERHMWPLLARSRPHDMLGVTAGYAGFHSSFLPQVARAAERHGAELRRLVARVARHDPVRIDEAYLEQAARELADTTPRSQSTSLVHFHAPQLSPERISNTMPAVDALLEAMVVSTAKRHESLAVLHLVPAKSPIHDFVMPEFVTEDEQVVMGRVTFGTLERLAEVVARAKDRVSLFLVSEEESAWARAAAEVVRREAPAGEVRCVRDREVRRSFLQDMLQQAAQQFGNDSLLIYQPDDVLLEVFNAGLPFETVFLYGVDRPARTTGQRTVILEDWRDWSDLMLRFDVILCGGSPSAGDAAVLSATLSSRGRILSLAPLPAWGLEPSVREAVIPVDLNKAYVGIVERMLAVESLLKSSAA